MPPVPPEPFELDATLPLGGNLEQLVASERAVFVEGGLERAFRGLEVDHREQRLRILGRGRLGVGPFGQLHRSSTGTVVGGWMDLQHTSQRAHPKNQGP